MYVVIVYHLFTYGEFSYGTFRGVPLVECSHYLVLLVGKIFHPEEACFLFFIVWVVVGGGGGRITFLHFRPCWDHFFQVSRVVRCPA